MGLRKSSMSHYVWEGCIKQPLPNPDPKNFKIISHAQIGKYLVVKINYPDCTNFEGMKICVYQDISYTRLLKCKSLDPHFSCSINNISPVARFEPTIKGWNMAILLCKNLDK